MQPTVIINHHRQTALIVATQGNKLLVIKLGKGQLTVTSLTTAEIDALGYQVSDYSPRDAARSYLQHGAGVSKRAKKYLEDIAHSQLSGTLGLT